MAFSIHNLQQLLSQSQIVQHLQQISQDQIRLQQQGFAQEVQKQASAEIEDVETIEETENMIIREDEESESDHPGKRNKKRKQKTELEAKQDADAREQAERRKLNPPGEGGIIDITI